MADENKTHDELRGATRLAVDGTTALTDLVQAMHDAVGVVPTWLGPGLVYSTIRGVTRAVGVGIERALAMLAPYLSSSAGSRTRELVIAALNGVLGDYLAASKNPLAITAGLRRHGVALELTREALAAAIPEASGRVLVMVHGSAASDLGWLWKGHDHGASLERDLGLTTIHVRYNSGLHISTNGAAMSALMTQLVSAWPVPIEDISILAHSAGGLVARSACVGDPAWLRFVHTMIFLGTPHHGAPLERGGNWIDLALGLTPWTRPLARLGKIRSAGVTDLRFGSILDSDWQRRDRFRLGRDPRTPVPLPARVTWYAVAADRDKLVPEHSAFGVDTYRPEMDLGIPAERRYVIGGDHLDLLSSADVYAHLRAWLSDRQL